MAKLTEAEKQRLPSTLARSPEEAQETFVEALESAEETYSGDERAAHRVAYAALKHSFEKVGDHWEPKERKGPSDPQAARGGAAARAGTRPTAHGVDANATKAHLLELAKRLGVVGRTRMTKEQLVEAIDRANRRETARARRG